MNKDLRSCGRSLLGAGGRGITEGQAGAWARVHAHLSVPEGHQEAAGWAGPAEGPESGLGAQSLGSSRSLTFPGGGIWGYDGKSAQGPTQSRGGTRILSPRAHSGLIPGSALVTERRVGGGGRSEARAATREPQGATQTAGEGGQPPGGSRGKSWAVVTLRTRVKIEPVAVPAGQVGVAWRETRSM